MDSRWKLNLHVPRHLRRVFDTQLLPRFQLTAIKHLKLAFPTKPNQEEINKYLHCAISCIKFKRWNTAGLMPHSRRNPLYKQTSLCCGICFRCLCSEHIVSKSACLAQFVPYTTFPMRKYTIYRLFAWM